MSESSSEPSGVGVRYLSKSGPTDGVDRTVGGVRLRLTPGVTYQARRQTGSSTVVVTAPDIDVIREAFPDSMATGDHRVVAFVDFPFDGEGYDACQAFLDDLAGVGAWEISPSDSMHAREQDRSVSGAGESTSGGSEAEEMGRALVPPTLPGPEGGLVPNEETGSDATESSSFRWVRGGWIFAVVAPVLGWSAAWVWGDLYMALGVVALVFVGAGWVALGSRRTQADNVGRLGMGGGLAGMGFALALVAILPQVGPGSMESVDETSIAPDDPLETVEVEEQEDDTEVVDPQSEDAGAVEQDDSLEEELQQDSGTAPSLEDEPRGPETNKGPVQRPGRTTPGASGRRPGSRVPPKGGPRGKPVRRKSR